jgi:hypothetical protein
MPFLQTHAAYSRPQIIEVRSSTPVGSVGGGNGGSGSKPGSVRAGSHHKEVASSGLKPGSTREGSKANSKPSSKKEDSTPTSNKGSAKEDDKKPSSKSSSNKAASETKKSNSADKNKAATKDNEDDKHQASNKKNSAGDIVFTPEEDAKLLSMKADNKAWNDIAAAINKTKKQTTKRFGDIKPADWKPQTSNDKATIEKAIENKNKDKSHQVEKTKEGKESYSKPVQEEKAITTDKHNHHHHHRDLDLADHHHNIHLQVRHTRRHSPRHHHHHHHHHTPLTPPSIISTSNTNTTTTSYTVKTMPALVEDDLFSFGELQAMSELIDADMNAMWQRVSGAFFAMTGKRIASEDIRDKFSGLQRADTGCRGDE